MAVIKSIKAIKVLNSRGDWTIKTYLELEGRHRGWAIVPDGASKGEREAVCFEADEAIRILDEKIAPELVGKDFKSQKDFDDYLCRLDGTGNKSVLGGNTVLSLSIAFCRAMTHFYDLDLWGYLRHEFLHTPEKKSFDLFSAVNPTPLFNILNGGKHAQNNLSFQEFMVIPAKKYNLREAIEVGRTVYKSLKTRLEKDGFSTGVGDEGGFAPQDFTVKKALSYIKESASEHYKVGEDVFLGMDVAADSFYADGVYTISEEQLKLDGAGLLNYYADLVKEHELIYLEDIFYEHDVTDWQNANRQLGKKVMISADDLVVTNPMILSNIISEKLANTVIVKPNQIGTVWETLHFVSMARSAGLSVVVSHRSGDTEDPFIADLAYAVGADFVKFGAVSRGERTSKFNRLLEIELPRTV